MSLSSDSLAALVAATAEAINQADYVQAKHHCQKLLELAPAYPQSHFFQGVIAQAEEQIDEAIAHMEQAIALAPETWLEPYLPLARLYHKQGLQKQAIDKYAHVTRHEPSNAQAWFGLAVCYADGGMLQNTYTYLQEALAREPHNPEYQRTLLFHLPAIPGLTDKQRAALFRQWAARYMDPLMPDQVDYKQSREPGRKLRIGYVSSDFRSHAAAFNLKALFEYHNRDYFEVYAYAQTRYADHLTQDYQALATVWHEVDALSDVQLAELIHRDQIDILVDCSGHTAGNRLGAFAYKPAPIQISAFGFIFTTGMKAIDYQISDEFATPSGREAYFTEKLLHLPTQLCWSDWQIGQELVVNEAPVLTKGHITFGSANGSFKHNDYVLKIWAAILKQVPHSRLHLKHTGFGNAGVQEMVRMTLAKEGIAPERVQFTGKTSIYDHMAFHHHIDIALDPFPYTGGMTTCETLFMGVPLIALDGDGIRTSQSLLNLVGAPELIAKTAEEYVFKAVALARNTQRLRDYRHSLRGRLQASPIMDGRAFSASVEAAYRIVWERWCQQA